MNTAKHRWIACLAMSMLLVIYTIKTTEAADVEYEICLDAFPELSTTEDSVEPLIKFTFPLSMEWDIHRRPCSPIALNFGWAINRNKDERESYWDSLAPGNPRLWSTDRFIQWSFPLSGEWEQYTRRQYSGWHGFIVATQ